MDIVYRKAVRGDIPAIEKLFMEMLRSVNSCEDAAGYEDRYLNKFFSESGGVIYVSEAEGGVIGYISVELHDSFIYLDDLSVAEKSRGKGIGTKLIEFAERYGRDKSVVTAVLHVEKSNEKAYRLYTRLGYAVTADEGSRYRMAKQIQR